MTAEPANLLIAVLCLTSLVLAGGFTHTLVTERSDVQFAVGSGSSFECPADRIIRPCASVNRSGDFWSVQLLPPFLEDLIAAEDSDGQSPPAESTPEGGTPATPSPSEDGADTGTASAEPTALADSTTPETAAPPTTSREAGGLGMGAELDWILWPVLGLFGGLGIVGLALSFRRSALDSPGDVLQVVAFGPMVLLSHLVRLATDFAARLQAAWTAGRTRLATLAAARPASEGEQIGRRLASPGRLLAMISEWVTELVDRLRQPSTSSPARDRANRVVEPSDGLPSFADGEFDVSLAWGWFARLVNGRDPRGRTPDDIARAAVDRGFPRSAVTELLTAFRDVTYGGQSPTGDRLSEARQAYDRLREAERTSGQGDE